MRGRDAIRSVSASPDAAPSQPAIGSPSSGVQTPLPTRRAPAASQLTDSETRVLARTAVVLLLVSAARYTWEVRREPPVLPEIRDDLPDLLAGSRRLAAENARRALPLGGEERIDPNEASEVELDRLAGVGPSLARAIVEARERDGAFLLPEDLLRVRGVGPATLERIRPHLDFPSLGPAARPGARGAPPPLRISGVASPLDLNRATAAELEELPGIGPALAERVLARRRARGGFTRPDELLEVRGIGPATLERLRPLVVAGGR